MLRVYVFDDPQKLWAHLESAKTEIVFPNELARSRFLALNPKTTFASITNNELNKLLGSTLVGKQSLTANEQIPYLRNLLNSMPVSPEIKRLQETEQGLVALRNQISFMQMRADRTSLQDCFNDQERDLVAIKDQMTKDEAHDQGGLMSLVASEAYRYQTGPLIFAPSGIPSPQLSRIAKGLAFNQEISMYLLLAKSQLELALQQADLLDAEIITDFSNQTLTDCLFTQNECLDQSEWIISENQIEAAVDIVAKWKTQGKTNIGLCLDARFHEALLEEAARRGISLLAQRRIGVYQSRLGRHILSLVNQTPSIELPDLLLEAQKRFAPSWPMSSEQQKDKEWLKGFERSVAAFTKSGLWPETVAALESIAGPQTVVGGLEDPVVFTYRNAPSFQLQDVVYLGLDSYPSSKEHSAFVSSQMLEKQPLLKELDQRPEFASALAAGKTKVFVCQSADRAEPGAFWFESLRAGQGEPKLHQGAARSRVLERLARSNVVHDNLSDIERRAPRIRIEDGAVVFDKNKFSVTELEAFLSCPYGWFVRYGLRVRSAAGSSAQLGNLAHEILENAANGIVALDQMNTAVDQGLLTQAQAEFEKRQLQKVIDKYPFNKTQTEVDLYSETILQKAIIGRADRIEILPEGALVIDYKRSKSPKGQDKKELQRFLYPLLAGEHFKVEPLGCVYVSIKHGEHSGSLARSCSYSNQYTDHDWAKNAALAVERANNAIQDISLGKWHSIGENCAEWCPHHWISRTVSDD